MNGPFVKAVPGQALSHFFEDQRTVSAAKAEGVAQGVLHTGNLTRFVWNEVEVAAFIRVVEVDRRRNRLIAQRQDRVNRLYRPCRTQQMPGHGFGRAHQYAARRITEDRLNRLRFRFIAGRRRGTVGVDVADLARFDARIANSIHHCQRGARAIFRR